MSNGILGLKGDRPAAADETTPLLVASQAGPTAPNDQTDGTLNECSVDTDDDDTPLPKIQIALLCYSRLVEPIAFFCIFPFINEMIYRTGNLDQKDVGFYTGLIESLFSLVQMFFMLPWGRAADRFGRKPVLVISLAGVSVCTFLFGFSTEIWQMILCRCCGGVFAGTVVTVRTMISENSTKKTQARAFSWFAFTSNCGIFIGPLIGGSLCNPATQYPSVFGGVQLFIDYPYALPTIITGLIGVSATILTALFANETLTPDRVASNKTSPPVSTRELIKSPGVTNVLFIYGWVMLLALAYTAVVPIFWFTDVVVGGVGLSPLQISLFLAEAGFAQAVWSLLVFPPLQHRIGSGGVMRVSAVVWPIFFLAWPFGNFLLKQHWDLAFWIIAGTVNFVGAGVSMAFIAVQLALNDIAPSHATLGTLNAIALTIVTATRGIAPALFASIYAFGLKTQIFGGYLIWVVLALLAIALIPVLRWLPAKAEGIIRKSSAQD